MTTTTAQDLMTKRFLRISTEHTLRETMGLLLYGEQKKTDTGAIAVIDVEAEFAGILTPRDVVRGLTRERPERGGDDEEQFLLTVQEHFKLKVGDILAKDQPKVSPHTTLAELVRLAARQPCECFPVLEDGRVEGIVYITDIFKAAAEIALTPGSEGIELKEPAT